MKHAKKVPTFVASSLSWVVMALVVAMPLIAAGQSEPVEMALEKTGNRINLSDAHTRCGDYFVLESRTFGTFDVKQVHVVLPMSDKTVGLVGLYYSDIHTVIDDAKDTPALVRQKDASGRETDEVRLSRAAFETAKACLPAPKEK